MNLIQPNQKKKELTEQQQSFLTNLFENGGDATQAALDAGYSRGSVGWLRSSLAN